MKGSLTERDYDLILESMVDGLFTVDRDCIITFWNKAAEEITGYSREEAVGQRCDFLESSTCMVAHNQNENKKCGLFTQGSVNRKRCIVKSKDGRQKYLLKNAQVLKDDRGEIRGGIESIVDITEQVEAENKMNLLRKELDKRASFYKLVGNHYKMQNIYDLIELAKTSSSSVLIYGESGTGKELVAQAIHATSRKNKGPFVHVNCSALAESLLESEMFGHVRGAFTDAIRDRKGRFEEANKGTIFLDEIGDLPLSVQIKLLKVLQNREFERVGDNRPIKIDVRVIAATHKDLKRQIDLGEFRDDLFYRLNVIPITVPPLRDRKTDIPLLTRHFIDKYAAETAKYIIGCDQYALDSLMRYNWPGNVRELENAIEYAFVTCQGDLIRQKNLPEQVTGGIAGSLPAGFKDTDGVSDERHRILKALSQSGGARSRAAELLGYSRVTLWKKMKKYAIEPDAQN